jgi:adenylate cyclase 2
VYGVYHQVLTTISQEDSYKNTIKFIDGRMKLEKEKQQQELLMVSVLPAHIALEMKTEMLRKTCKAQMKSMLDSEKFYNQNESNVSMLFIVVLRCYQADVTM